MAKLRSNYVCQSCGHAQVNWAGKCPSCGEWNTMVETVVEAGGGGGGNKTKTINVKAKPLSEITPGQTTRVSTKIPELDRVLGGGMVPGQVILMAGEPGIGKSTILLQLCQNLDQSLYISGEESINQIKIRADRLGIKSKNIDVMETTDIDTAVAAINAQPGTFKGTRAVIVDSIQTMSTSDLSGMAGSAGQVRESAYRLVGAAKRNSIPLYIVGHVTKEGTVAGPSLLAHLVDTVLWFEGDKTTSLRLLRAYKNRFGATDEVGIFGMDASGLVSIDNASEAFVSGSAKAVPGSCKSAVLEGTRPLLAEIQSLVVPSKLANPRRVVQGIDSRRAEIVLAILARRAGVPANYSDVFISVVGGITLREPAIDLALALALASAHADRSLPKNTLAIGEVDLTGEIREVPMMDKRIKEAQRLGYRNIITRKKYKYISQAVRELLK